MALTVEPLQNAHDRKAFACGQPGLDDWFKRRAGQDERRNLARVFVALDDDLGVLGFYSLSAFTLALEDLPPDLAGKLPRSDAIPAALIRRLARDLRVKGQGVGDLLLADALQRILGVTGDLAVFAILVNAEDEAARVFYAAFGFKPFPDRPNRLFLLTSTVAAAAELAEPRVSHGPPR
ncbi:N-acetyltransferase [Phenylobacterium sp.]|uniref:N-acetyltransferase n=1 Tax=Phenylobacterium sp. TaxID=1871053 RepID=UPI0035AEE7E9